MVAINVVLVILGLAGGFFLSRYFSNRKLKKFAEKYSELEVKYDELERDCNILHNISLDTISQLQKEKKEIALGINNKSKYVNRKQN